jgi:hypothetical protein
MDDHGPYQAYQFNPALAIKHVKQQINTMKLFSESPRRGERLALPITP